MKILYSSDIPISFVAGISTFMKQLAKGIQDGGHEVGIICASKSYNQETFIHEGIHFFGISSFPSIVHRNLRIAFPVGVRRQIIKAFIQFQPNVVHIQSHGPLSSSVITEAQKRKIPTMGTNHFVPENIYYHLNIPKVIQPTIRLLMWKHMHSVFRRLDYITTPTDAAAQILHKSGFKKNVVPISNGVDLTMFNTNSISEVSKITLRYKYGLGIKATLLYVGRLDPEKNTKFLIETIPLVIKELDMQLIIVGTGGEGQRLKKLVRQLHLQAHIFFTDYLPDQDLPTMYGLASCFVMPGTAELQGISLMEAMASGLPVITANALALPELVSDGFNGFLYNHGDREALSKYIIMLLKDGALRKRMGVNSLETIRKHQIQNTVAAFENIYNQLSQQHTITMRGSHTRGNMTAF